MVYVTSSQFILVLESFAVDGPSLPVLPFSEVRKGGTFKLTGKLGGYLDQNTGPILNQDGFVLTAVIEPIPPGTPGFVSPDSPKYWVTLSSALDSYVPIKKLGLLDKGSRLSGASYVSADTDLGFLSGASFLIEDDGTSLSFQIDSEAHAHLTVIGSSVEKVN
jgi:hypothetical protein